MYEIIRRDAFSDTTFLWEVAAPDVARSAEPGHFVMLRLHEGSERIPLTVADFDRDAGTVSLVIQALGKTTAEMRDRYKAGDTVLDFVGPLGLPQHVGTVGHVVLVGGGLGVAPVFPQLRAFKAAGNRVTGIIGFRSESLVFWEERFSPHCDDLIVCTDDGSYGRPGFVTDAFGFALLVPAVRMAALRWVRRRVKVETFRYGQPPEHEPNPDVIDADYVEVPPRKRPTHSPSGWTRH